MPTFIASFRVLVTGAALLCATAAKADLVGFDPATFQYNTNDSGSPPVLGPGSIHLTTGSAQQRRSIFFLQPQDITEFSASFTYRASNIAASTAGQGIAFVLQNSSQGVNALGGGLGYIGMAPSAAVTFQNQTGTGRTYSGFFTNGGLSLGEDVFPVNAFSGHEIDVTVTYSGSTLAVNMVDAVTGSTFVGGPYLVGSLPSILGSSTAYVGFTAGTGDFFGNGGANQYLSDFRFGAIPEPTTIALLSLAGTVSAMRRCGKHR